MHQHQELKFQPKNQHHNQLKKPTGEPTKRPTSQPSEAPTKKPTSVPTKRPSDAPYKPGTPSNAPTHATGQPTKKTNTRTN